MHEYLNPRFLTDASSVKRLADRCSDQGCVALDTEADSLHAYFHKVCLIQVTVDSENFVVDPLALSKDEMAPLLEVVADPAVTVLMHGADYDIRVLDRDYGARVRGLQDTQIMAHLLGEERTGLAVLLQSELGVGLDKKHQRANWGKRPLSDSMLSYAAADTAYLGALTARLRKRLEASGRWEWAKEEFIKLEEVRHVPPVDDPYAFERVKGVAPLRGAARNRAYSLFQWRDCMARELDMPPFKVLGNLQLVDLAACPPEGLDALASRKGLGPRFVRRWGRRVMAIFRDAATAPAKRRVVRQPGPAAAIRARTEELLSARDHIARELEVQPSLLCPRAMALDLAQFDDVPRDAADLAERGLTGWRLEVLGEAFLAALQESEL